mgnify:FL=1
MGGHLVAFAMAPPDATTGPGPYEVRSLDAIEEFHACEAVMKVVWQVDDRELVPASHLRATQHAGGFVAGAFHQGRLVGFLAGFLARPTPTDPLGLHSHLMGVLPEVRRAGLGRALKWYQRRWALERDLPWIRWTFDPLHAHAARLNLEALGAVGVAYERDFYGRIGGVLAGSLASDRLLARWDLGAERVLARAGGAAPADPEAAEADAAEALGRDGDDAPTAPRLALDADVVAVAAPLAFARDLHERPEVAAAWRQATRATFEAYLARGYRAERFVHGRYLLRRRDGAAA